MIFQYFSANLPFIQILSKSESFPPSEQDAQGRGFMNIPGGI